MIPVLRASRSLYILRHLHSVLLAPVPQRTPEITAYVEKSKIKKLTGVKAKELLVWITLEEILADDSPTGKITFKTPAGLFRTFPRLAFEIEEEEKKVAPPPDQASQLMSNN